MPGSSSAMPASHGAGIQPPANNSRGPSPLLAAPPMTVRPPRRLLSPAIPTRKTSHPDARAAARDFAHPGAQRSHSYARNAAVTQAQPESSRPSSASAVHLSQALRSPITPTEPHVVTPTLSQAPSDPSAEYKPTRDSVMSVTSIFGGGGSAWEQYAALVDGKGRLGNDSDSEGEDDKATQAGHGMMRSGSDDPLTSGLGIAGLGPVASLGGRHHREALERSSPSNRTIVRAGSAQEVLREASGSADIGYTNTSNGSQSQRSPSLYDQTPKLGLVTPTSFSSSLSKRKSKPKDLVLTSPAASPRLPGSGQSPLAPSTPRGRTPPPTNPPAEPLPPLPATASAYITTFSRPDLILEPRSSSARDDVAMRDSLSTARSGERSTDADGHLPSQAATAVADNHLQTLAAAKNAEALLKTLQPTATYNETRQSDYSDDEESDAVESAQVFVGQRATLAPANGLRRESATQLRISSPPHVVVQEASPKPEAERRDTTVPSGSLKHEQIVSHDVLRSLSASTPSQESSPVAVMTPLPHAHHGRQRSSPSGASYPTIATTFGTGTAPSSNAHSTVSQLGKFSGSFGEIATAFKQLQAEKRTLEKVIRATTPLSGIGDDSEDLIRYLTSMNAKLEVSSTEIQKLLDLLDRQRSVMDYMLETHEAEIDSHLDEIDDVRYELEDAVQTVERHRVESTQLRRQLDQTQEEAFALRQEANKAKIALAEETKRREQVVRAMETYQSNMEESFKQAQASHESRIKAEAEHVTLLTAHETLRAEADSLRRKAKEHESRAKSSEALLEELRHKHEEETSKMGADHEREIWNLKDTHEADVTAQNEEVERMAERLMAHHSEALHMLRGEHEQTIEELQARLAATEASQEASVAAKRELLDTVDSKDEQIVLLTAQVEQLSAQLQRQSEAAAVDHSHDSNESIRERQRSRSNTSFTEGSIIEDEDPVNVPASIASVIPGSPTEQIRQLTAQLSEQRSREEAIRGAYKQLRDEHRRLLQTSHKERRGSTTSPLGTYGFRGVGVGIGVASERASPSRHSSGPLISTSGSGRPSAASDPFTSTSGIGIAGGGARVPTSAPSNSSGATSPLLGISSRGLKRFSLPLMAKGLGTASSPQASLLSVPAHDGSAGESAAGGGGATGTVTPGPLGQSGLNAYRNSLLLSNAPTTSGSASSVHQQQQQQQHIFPSASPSQSPSGGLGLQLGSNSDAPLSSTTRPFLRRANSSRNSATGTATATARSVSAAGTTVRGPAVAPGSASLTGPAHGQS